MNEASEKLRCHIPQEFSRTTRPVTDVERWKAAQFRLFLFYTGPVILKSVLRPALYDNFLCLHSARSILANAELCRQHTEYAGALLRHFVGGFKKMYGEEQVSYNIHCLIHLADDVKVHGAVDDFSAFPSENNMRHVKKDLRKHGRPLQQLRNRMLERLQLPVVDHDDDVDFELSEHQNMAILPPECLGPEFGTARCGTFTVTRHTGNNRVMIDGHIVVVEKFSHLKASKEACVIGQEFCDKENFYTVPFESSRVEIFTVSKLSATKVWRLRNIKKMLLLPHAGRFVVFLEIHMC